MMMSLRRLNFRRLRTLVAGGALAATTFSAVGIASVATASPSGASSGTYCQAGKGDCYLYGIANTSGLYFEIGRIPVGMLCWEDGQWTNLAYRTNRWFEVKSAAYGIFWAPASEINNQIKTPQC